MPYSVVQTDQSDLLPIKKLLVIYSSNLTQPTIYNRDRVDCLLSFKFFFLISKEQANAVLREMNHISIDQSTGVCSSCVCVFLCMSIKMG